MLTSDEMKRLAGEYAVRFIEPGYVTGIGTGSTVYYFIHALAQKVKNGLNITAVATSGKTSELASQLGITVTGLNDVDHIDITIDGADEVDTHLQLIKGGGGALLQEKMVAAASRKMIVIADEHKVVEQLGSFALPVEVILYGWKQTQKHIADLGCKNIVLRKTNEKPFETDHHHYILDCHFNQIDNASLLTQQLNGIPGVVENGLFINMAFAAVIGKQDGTIAVMNK